jgi:hypothetical protein
MNHAWCGIIWDFSRVKDRCGGTIPATMTRWGQFFVRVQFNYLFIYFLARIQLLHKLIFRRHQLKISHRFFLASS